VTTKPLPTNAEIADRLELIGDLLEIGGEQSRHRILAYRRSAARVRGADESVAALAVAGRAVDLPDIGTTLQDKIVELVDTGEIGALSRLRERVPEGLAAVARLQGIGPKRARALFDELGVRDLEGLRGVVADERIGGVVGIGPKLVAQVTAQLAALDAGDGPAERIPVGRALPIAETLVRDLRAALGLEQLEIAGGLRRGAETVHDVDLAAGTDEPGALMDALAAHPMVTDVGSRGAAGIAVMTQSGIRVELRIGPVASFGNLLQHLTGSKAHNIRLRELAVKQALSLSEHGVTLSDGSVRTHEDEEGVYGMLGLPVIPPELREDTGELEVAAAGLLPRLVSVGDLVGDLHTHSTWSDGRDTIDAMVAAARALGLRYLAISDHSKSLAMARGLDEDRVRAQWETIDAVNGNFDDIEVLKACEVDVLADGALDYDDDLLDGFDWVTASLHSGFSQSTKQLTHRVLSAIEHPLVDAIGHPTGRMFGSRDGYELDLDAVVARAAATGTFLEVNSQPRRLDLRAEHARRALAGGARLVICTDAHSTGELEYRRYGVMTARRAGATAAQVANTLSLEELRAARPRTARAPS
jgi:DNA polymerase (family 10)